MRGYYSVFNPRGEKIADCGQEKDAVNLLSMRNRRWEGHYYTFTPLPGDVIDITKQLPYDMEVQYEYIETLPENTQDPLNL
tara:strand:+ start:241 stop:483 length:243 start_codon:yes stop_codon:yes gene_type:complete